MRARSLSVTPVATSAVRLSEGILNDGSRVVTGVGLVVRMINTRRRKEEERRKEERSMRWWWCEGEFVPFSVHVPIYLYFLYFTDNSYRTYRLYLPFF